jgi:hypothetical protein
LLLLGIDPAPRRFLAVIAVQLVCNRQHPHCSPAIALAANLLLENFVQITKWHLYHFFVMINVHYPAL